MTKLAVDAGSSRADVLAAVRDWISAEVPQHWLDAVARGNDVRSVRPSADYRAWYPAFARSGLVVPTWQPEHGGLGLDRGIALAIEPLLAPYRLYRLNPLGLNNAAAALLSHGTEDQKRRFLPPIVANTERWCQLFSEPGSGSDLASLATKAVRDGDEWIVTGQKVWSTYAHDADFAILLARTDPGVPKHRGITYFLLDLSQPAVDVRLLRTITGETEFNEVFLDGARIPDFQRVGDVGNGWRVSAATLSSERQMVAGSGSGGIGRLGGASSDRLISLAKERGLWQDPQVRQTVMTLWAEEQIRGWTNERVRAAATAGQSLGAAASIGKVHQATLNQRIQNAIVDLVGTNAIAWTATGDPLDMPAEVRGMLRSLANSIEGGTTEVNKNILAERVLGLPREPDPWHGKPWKDTPRS
jgi:alkylation response protein AidB-like acyl-CoA dehydrogenase